MQDITLVYYTANKISSNFFANTWDYLQRARNGGQVEPDGELELPMIAVSQKFMFAEDNIVVDFKPSHLNIYKQALIGAKAVKTKYIALCEDDVLYHPDHFKYRPPEGVFGYNMNVWAIYTWVKPSIFNYKDRINLSGLICERELFIGAMEERFAKYPDDSKTEIAIWAEPGKYEGPSHLGVTERKIEKFYADNPNVAFSHETALSFLNMGKRKKMGQPRALEIPYWGKASDIIKLYQ